MCGEHAFKLDCVRHGRGSSPRVRGTPTLSEYLILQLGFIPACAGNTSSSLVVMTFTTVHPRVCGEHDTISVPVLCSNGSSPRVRGTRCDTHPRFHGHRFIPACAGNTEGIAAADSVRTVHPRVCGELNQIMNLNTVLLGSSPRVRGTRIFKSYQFLIQRFIPACAGNTGDGSRRNCGVSVHPRVCGEHDMLWRPIECVSGSSPRVRGTRIPRH